MARKRKDKKYWEEEAQKARRSAKTSQIKLKSYKEGFKEGLRVRKGDEF